MTSNLTEHHAVDGRAAAETIHTVHTAGDFTCGIKTGDRLQAAAVDDFGLGVMATPPMQ